MNFINNERLKAINNVFLSIKIHLNLGDFKPILCKA